MTAVDERPVLVLDFDGTVCVGDAPVWAYADAVLDVIEGDPVVRGAIRAGLGAFLSGAPESPVYADGYAAVAALAAPHATAEQLGIAFRASRRALAMGEVPVASPSGLDAFLRGLEGAALRVLVTNAPAEGVRETLDRLGVADGVDRTITEAGKPAGWGRILPELLGARRPARLMSVGDIWRNDLAAPLAAGSGVALIDRFGQQSGLVHLVAPRFEDLYDDLAAWVREPEGFLAGHPPLPADRHPASQPVTDRITDRRITDRTGTT
jgi:FMN phosphatase YigB (HAD superfamily)